MSTNPFQLNIAAEYKDVLGQFTSLSENIHHDDHRMTPSSADTSEEVSVKPFESSSLCASTTSAALLSVSLISPKISRKKGGTKMKGGTKSRNGTLALQLALSSS